MIDLKTLYEQTTMCCELLYIDFTDEYTIDVFQQPDTPIMVYVYWSKELHKITSITYTIKGE